LKLIVDLGESFGASKLIDISSAHTVLNFGLNFVNAAAEILHQIAEADLKIQVPTTADPIIDMDYSEELSMLYPMFQLHDQMIEDLNRIGITDFTCTPYYIGNKPKFGDHCAWSESSAVIYLNSVIGGRSNREGGLVDIACGILGKTSYHGLHLKENRKGQVLFKLESDIDTNNLYNLTSLGLKIGEIAGSRIPVIEGLEHISYEHLKNLGAATASSGAVALIHVVGLTPEAKTKEQAFQKESPDEIIGIGQADLEEVRQKYSTTWEKQPKNISIGCPQLSKNEIIQLLHRLKGKKVRDDTNFWICTNKQIKEEIKSSEWNEIVEHSGVKITHLCPLLTPLPRPLVTNSAKTCFYSHASYKPIKECIKIATEGIKNG
jgi:predicted aconitase